MKKKKGSFSSLGGFTLIEIMVVVVIIGLLVSIVGPNMLGKVQTAKAKAARAQIENLGAALDLYYLETGTYPTTAEGLQALILPPANLPAWHGPYLKKTKVPLDPWGAPYLYQSPGKHGAYDLVSLGADGKEGGDGDGTDIVSWE